jgi:hypothetical protein
MNPELSRRVARAVSIAKPSMEKRFALGMEVFRALTFNDLSIETQNFIAKAESNGVSFKEQTKP